MTKLRNSLMLAAITSFGVAACTPAAKAPDAETTAGASAEESDPVKSALSAAPAAIAANATVVMANPDGTMKTLKPGTNGFTCMPDNPTTPGPDPMCMDANSLQWAQAWMSHKPPPAETPGVMFMLTGGTDASNTDPYAAKPTAGDDWIKTGPHLMVVGSASVLKGYPSGAKPDTAAPYVMWAGTPYAHLMVPVS